MKFLVISDLHGATGVLDKMNDIFAAADAVMFAGDFAEFSHEETARPALEKLCSVHKRIFSVIGNCDPPALLGETEAAGINVQGKLVDFEGLKIAGSGGGTKFMHNTPYEREEEDILKDLDAARGADGSSLIVIMHNPPKGSDCDKVAPLVHVGSKLLSDFIERFQPLAVVTGHIHESRAVCKIGRTVVINPGPLSDGDYAWLEVERGADGWSVTKAALARV